MVLFELLSHETFFRYLERLVRNLVNLLFHVLHQGGDSIESYHYNLGKRTTVVPQVAPNCRGLLFFDGSLIYADHEDSEIKKVAVEHPQRGGTRVLNKEITWVMDIKAFHGSVQTGRFFI